MPSRSIELTDQLDRFVESGIVSGRYGDASEVVREALTLLEVREARDQAKLAWLRKTAQDAVAALDRGEGIPIRSREDVSAMINEALQKVRTSSRA